MLIRSCQVLVVLVASLLLPAPLAASYGQFEGTVISDQPDGRSFVVEVTQREGQKDPKEVGIEFTTTLKEGTVILLDGRLATLEQAVAKGRHVLCHNKGWFWVAAFSSPGSEALPAATAPASKLDEEAYLAHVADGGKALKQVAAFEGTIIEDAGKTLRMELVFGADKLTATVPVPRWTRYLVDGKLAKREAVLQPGASIAGAIYNNKDAVIQLRPQR